MQPRGLTLKDASAYCGVGVSTFRRWVHLGIMPDVIAGTSRYDRLAIDRAWDKMSKMDRAPAESAYDEWKAAE